VQRYEKALTALARRKRLRSLEPRRGIDFSSNDYLALAGSELLRGAIERALAQGTAVGAGASRLLRGNHPEHEALEMEAASFFGVERSLYFSGGFIANYAVLSLLPARDDLVVCDELIHASCREGVRAGEARHESARHNDAAAFDDAIRGWRDRGATGRPWIVVESLYSMDGDCAPLAELQAVAARHDAMLVIDEAHATGVHGPRGRGLAAGLAGRENVVCVHTCGKALGAMGALVCAPAALIDFMVNRSRPFIYATAPSPLMATAVREALAILRTRPQLRGRLADLIGFANREVSEKCGVTTPGSQILPVVLGDSARALAVAAALRDRGYDVRAIRPPTVPEGTARLRISITLHVDEPMVAAMLDSLGTAMQSSGRAS
jgi:8-amino-7-oxononanoate synthase